MPDNVRSLFTDSRVQMAEVIAGLIQGRSVKDVASALDIPPARIGRWYRESKEFQEMLVEVEEEVIASIRAVIVEEQTDAVVNMLPQAKKVLAETIADDSEAPPSVKLAAAAHVFRLAGYDSKHGGQDIARPPAPGEDARKDPAVRPAAGD